MPYFEHRCIECEEVMEVLCKFEEDEHVCKFCGGLSKRIMSAPQGIHFKGTGFYETDYKSKRGLSNSDRQTIENTEQKLNKSLGGGDVNGL